MPAAEPSHHDLSTDPELGDWRVILDGLQTRLMTGDFATGARLVGRIAEVADELDHHPDVDLRYRHVTVSTVSHDVGRLTGRDRRLASAISRLAREEGVEAAPRAGQRGGDRARRPRRACGGAVLGGRPRLRDRRRDQIGTRPARLAPMWFQQMEEARPGRGRFHLDITVPHDVARERVDAAVAAGGRLVTDEFAPSWWVLADTEGNEVCVCTWQGREGSGEQPV